jgi:hypothetical protein
MIKNAPPIRRSKISLHFVATDIGLPLARNHKNNPDAKYKSKRLGAKNFSISGVPLVHASNPAMKKTKDDKIRTILIGRTLYL